jgi:hypothetical protein
LTASLSSETTSKALLISERIKNDANFNVSENYFSLKYTKGSFDKNFNLTQKMIYYENDELKSTSKSYEEKNPDNSEDSFTLTKNNEILIPISFDQTIQNNF